MCHFRSSLAVKLMNIWASSWRRNSHSATQRSTTNMPGNMEIALIPPLVCKSQFQSRKDMYMCPRTDPQLYLFFGLGYKLAFNYLKAKRHVDAIDVCHKVCSKFLLIIKQSLLSFYSSLFRFWLLIQITQV